MDPDQVLSIAGSVREFLRGGDSFDVAFGKATDGMEMTISEAPTVKSVVGRIVGENRRQKRRGKPTSNPEPRPYRPPYSDPD